MRLIDADKLPKYDGYALSATAVAQAVENAPTIEAEPIRHGHWEHGEDVFGMYCQCSECGNQYYGGYEFKYCPNCGAKMDEEEQA